MIRQAFTLLLILTTSLLYGQTAIVVDKTTKAPLENCSIYFPDYHTGTNTNERGEASLKNYSSINLNIQISLVGYKTVLVSQTIKDSTYVFELEPSHIQMQEVVISAPKGKLQKENITHIERKDISELKSSGVNSLVQAITNIAGVEQQSTGVGIGKPIIRGLSGNRIVVYAQDIRQENQQWGDEHGLGIGDVGIEAVEVIKGPSSLLYGSDALGGVLYFVEERYAKENKTEAYIQTNLQSNNQAINGLGAFKINKNKLKLNLFGGYTSTTDYQVPNFSRANNSRFNETNFKTAFGYAHKKWVTNIRYSFLQNNFGITEDSILTKSIERNIELPFQTIINNSISFNNSFYLNKSTLNIVLGYSTNNRKEFSQNADTTSLAMQLNTFSFNAKWTKIFKNENYNLIIGSQGMHQTNKNLGIEYLIPNGQINDFGLYGLLNGKIKNVNFQGGVRLDYRNVKVEQLLEDTLIIFKSFQKQYVNPNFSFGISYNKNNWTLRANVANGFRSPNFAELSANGVHEGTKRYEIGNQNLKIENAIQADVSMDYMSEHFQFSINPFINRIQNYIYLQPTSQFINGLQVYKFLQTNATLYGGELGIHYHPHTLHWLHLESNLSTTIAQDDNNNPLPLIPQTRIRTTAKVEVGKVIKNVFISNTYKFYQDRISEFETQSSAYNLPSAGFNLQTKICKQLLDISFAINNILNTQYIDHLSRFKIFGIPNQGINFNLTMKYTIGQK